MAKKSAGLLYGPEKHHLDHLAPLCSLFRIPLIVTEEELFDLCKHYYPSTQAAFLNYLTLPEKIVKEYDTLFTCLPRDLIDEVLFFAQQMFRKKIHTIWCPHGNSDKGHASFLMEGLQKEQSVLVYGKKMIDFLIRKHVYENLRSCIIVGNFRYYFYLQHRDFYLALIQKEVKRRLQSTNKTILYAPTWQDREQSSSFFDVTPSLIELLPDSYNLIIKPHPNLLFKSADYLQKLIDKYEARQNILFLTDFPPIYPLLDFVDIYLGDMSSIGYDFLTFNKPMFFLNQNARNSKEDPGLYLYRCGIEIQKEEYKQIFSLIEKNLPHDQERFSKVRQEVYVYTFGKERKWATIEQELHHTIDSFGEDDLIFW